MTETETIEEIKERIKTEAFAEINAAESAGKISPQEADLLKQKWALDASQQSMSPAERDEYERLCNIVWPNKIT